MAEAIGDSATVIESHSVPGAGSVPGEMIPSPAVQISGDADALWQALIAASPPVLARRSQGHLEIDLRTIPADNDEYIVRLISAALDV